jgi:hypothetical protein
MWQKRRCGLPDTTCSVFILDDNHLNTEPDLELMQAKAFLS